MKIAIVGHGPSLMMGEAGEEIDSCDLVVRIKRCQETLRHPKHYGTVTDVVCGSFTIAPALKGIGGAREYWVFLDSRHDEIEQKHIEAITRHFEPWATVILPDQCRNWNQRYREARDEMILHEQMQRKGDLSDAYKGHNHMSAGLHAILYANHLYPDAELLLFGCDNLVTGNFNWSVTRGPDYKEYPDHNWATEKKLLDSLFGDQDRLQFWMPEEMLETA